MLGRKRGRDAKAPRCPAHYNTCTTLSHHQYPASRSPSLLLLRPFRVRDLKSCSWTPFMTGAARPSFNTNPGHRVKFAVYGYEQGIIEFHYCALHQTTHMYVPCIWVIENRYTCSFGFLTVVLVLITCLSPSTQTRDQRVQLAMFVRLHTLYRSPDSR